MSYRLTTAIDLADAATAVLNRVKAFDRGHLLTQEEMKLSARIGIDPMLLALSMELALKAWFVFDHDTPKVKRTHNLSKLFGALSQESQKKLDSEFKLSVAPSHFNGFFMEYGIEDILTHHANAFVDWRYLYERKLDRSGKNQTISFSTSGFQAMIEMVLREFRKRYREEKIPPRWGSKQILGD